MIPYGFRPELTPADISAQEQPRKIIAMLKPDDIEMIQGVDGAWYGEGRHRLYINPPEGWRKSDRELLAIWTRPDPGLAGLLQALLFFVLCLTAGGFASWTVLTILLDLMLRFIGAEGYMFKNPHR